MRQVDKKQKSSKKKKNKKKMKKGKSDKFDNVDLIQERIDGLSFPNVNKFKPGQNNRNKPNGNRPNRNQLNQKRPNKNNVIGNRPSRNKPNGNRPGLSLPKTNIQNPLRNKPKPNLGKNVDKVFSGGKDVVKKIKNTKEKVKDKASSGGKNVVDKVKNTKDKAISKTFSGGKNVVDKVKNKIEDAGDNVVDSVSSITDKVSETIDKVSETVGEVIEKGRTEFENAYGLKRGINLSTQRMSPISKTFLANGIEIALNIMDMKPVNVFSTSALYYLNDEPSILPTEPSVFMQELANNERLRVLFDKRGEVKDILILNKLTGKRTNLVSMERGSLVSFTGDDIDIGFLNNNFKLGHPFDGQKSKSTSKRKALEEGDYHTLRSSQGKLNNEERELIFGKSCSEFKVIDMVIAFDSSFCKHFDNSDEAIQELIMNIADVNQIYEQVGICTKIEISRIDGYCDASIDPYYPYMLSGESGCGEEPGVLQEFTYLWNTNKRYVTKNTAFLFTGTDFECVFGNACVVGCAYVGVLCNPDYGYGLVNTKYTSNSVLQAVLIAHELGHNAGELLSMDSNNSYSINEAKQDFPTHLSFQFIIYCSQVPPI